MHKRTKFLFALVVGAAALFITGCGGSDNGEDVVPPGEITLLTPSGNSACIKGSTSNGETTSSVTFTWKEAPDAEKYRIEITNLNAQTTSSHDVTTLSYSERLDVNVYYSWCVSAINSVGSTSSDTLKFYLADTPASNYAPFPADLTSPITGAIINANGAATVLVEFRWNATDLDDDIADYIFFIDNTDASTPVMTSLVSATATQTLESGKTYYWKVKTTDKSGNSSMSSVNMLQVQ